jgi:mRNA-degrading endonuclease RelE of RelBE toxin-antitoxin system
MATDPFQGDVIKLEGEADRYRRRVGSFRIFFRVDRPTRTVGISAIVRRTSTTY